MTNVFPPTPGTYLCLILSGNATFIILFITIQCIINLLCRSSMRVHVIKRITHPKKRKTPKTTHIPTPSLSPFIRYVTTLSLLLYLIGNLASLSAQTLISIGIDISLISPIGITSFGLWLSARCAMHAAFIYRLKKSFENTIYSYSQQTYITLYIMLFVYPLLIFTIITFKIITVIDREPDLRTTLGDILLLFVALLIIYDICFIVSLLYLFQRKLAQLIKSYIVSFREYTHKQQQEMQLEAEQVTDIDLIELQVNDRTHSSVSLHSETPQNAQIRVSESCDRKNTTKSISDSIFTGRARAQTMIELEIISKHQPRNKHKRKIKKYKKYHDEKKSALIDTMTQYTLLITLSIVTSLCIMCNTVLSANYFNASQDTQLRIYFYAQFSLNIDSLINSVCLYLHFPFSWKLYRCLCLRLHRSTANCCIQCIDRKVINEGDNE